MILLKPERAKKKSRNWRKIKRKLPFVTGLVIFAGIIYGAFFSQLFKIENLVIEGNKNIPFDELKGEIDSRLGNKILFLIPSNNLLLVREQGLETELREQFKRIETIQVNKKFLKTLQISLKEKRGAFKWCRPSGCFLINEQGSAYNIPLDESSLTEEEKTLLTIHELSNPLPNAGEKIIDDKTIKAIWQINDELGTEISEFDTPSSFSNRISIKFKEGWQLNFRTDTSIESQIHNFRSLFPEEITLEQKKNLEYIDLTVEGRAYYKFKSANPETENTEPKNQKEIKNN